MDHPEDILRWLLLLAAVESVVAVGFVLLLLARNRRITGPRRFASFGPRLKWRLLSIPVIAALAVVLFAAPPATWIFAVLLIASLGNLFLQPHWLDQVCGQEGVQNGWRSRSFEDLEEWRLTGDHLRFRLSGMWVAVPVPTPAHEEFRSLLEAKCPGKESRFSR